MNARSSTLMTRIFPVTVTVALDRASLELLPALSSTGPGSMREALSCILDAGKRADAVIARNRERFRSQTVVKEPLDLNRLILETVAIARPPLQSGRVSLATVLAGGLPPVDGDRIQLQRVILNLVGNAVDAMECRPPSPGNR
jgi:signal transduction histidine kinase